jgi:hypothetical protein
MDSWNAIGKHWLQKYDKKFGANLSAAFHFIYNFFPNVISVYIVPVKNT